MSKTSITFLLSICIAAFSTTGLVRADLRLSGQINRMIADIDDSVDSEIKHLDNSGSGTRIRINGEHDAGNGIKVGFYWETQYQSNDSSEVEIRSPGNQDDLNDDDGGNGGFQARHRDLYIRGGFGKISLGQGNGAANGITEMEYTGTTFLTGSANPQDIWRSLEFKNSDPDLDREIDVGDVYNGMDALSRNDRLRYDSPKLGAFIVSVDSGNGKKTEAAIRFDFDLGAGGKIKGGVGSWDEKDAEDEPEKGTAGSIAYLHGSGVNVALAFGEMDKDDEELLAELGGNPADTVNIESQMLILGFKRGDHAFSLRGGTTDSFMRTAGGTVQNISADATGFGYVNTSIKATELYLGYQLFEIDLDGAEELSIVFAGARVKF